MSHDPLQRGNPLRYLTVQTWKYAGNWRPRVVITVILFVIAQSVDLFIPPLLWARIMDTVQGQGITPESMRTLALLLAGTLIADVVFWVFHGPARVWECTAAFAMRMHYRRHFLKGVMTLPLEWHVDHHSGDTIDKIGRGASGLYDFSSQSYAVIYAIVKLVGSYAMLAYFSPPAGVIVLVMVLLTGWIITRFDRVLVRQYDELNRAENAIAESVFDAISNIATAVILRVERLVFDAIMAKVVQPFALYRKNCRVNEVKWFLTNICCNLMVSAVLLVYFWQHIGTPKGILVGTVYLLIKYLENVSQLFFNFAYLYGEILQRRSRVRNAEELAVDFRSESFANHVLPPEWRHLEVAGLNFSYAGPDTSAQQLIDISFTILRGERIALVGATGSGKTTLLKVMRDLYHPQSGSLVVDGVPIAEGFAGIARAISLIPQEPEIFASTILKNVTMGAEHEMASVARFVEMADFASVVEQLPRGYDSLTKERGVSLSGGQKQRLALSRGLLASSDKDIILIDEPTSSLDAATELRVYQNIFEAFAPATIISSIHRLHLLPLFDRIFMFDAGRIVAIGTIDELLSSCRQFQELWRAAKGEDANMLENALPL